jgi:RimJ/RimL family protein N-acetyltransferase
VIGERRSATAPVLKTRRLVLRELAESDADFVLELLNDADFLRFIGDRGVRTPESARHYILNGPVASYSRHGFGLYLVELADTGRALGMCGLVKRETLADVDIGFAFLPAHRAQGYATEAAAAVLAHGRDNFGLRRIVAIVAPDNERSANVLVKIGLGYERMIKLSAEEPEIRLYAWEAAPT